MIKRLWLFNFILIIFLLLSNQNAMAQFTSVTGTVTDSDSQTWNNGSWSVTIYNQYPQSPPSINGTPLTANQLNQKGSLDSGGSLSLTLADSSIIAPAGTYWVFTICPNASSQCAIVNTPVSGSSQNISSILSSNLRGPRFSANTINGGAFGYLDSEIYPAPNPGAEYYNVTTGCKKVYNNSSWTCFNTGVVGGITALIGDGAAGPASGTAVFTLANVNSVSGTCGDSTHTCQVTTNAKGLTTSQNSIAIAFPNAITGLSGDLSATGPGNVTATLATVNSSPGTCGDATHVCQTTANGKGLITNQTSIAISGTVPLKTCNSNGCYSIFSDGHIEADGNSGAIGSTGGAFNVSIVFPTSFTTTTNLFLVVSATTSATGDGNPHPAECHVVRSSLSTTGATAVISASTQIGGSGYADLAVGDYCTWHAIGF